jgi:putative SOS response-associated peptidase YedK
MCGRYTYKLSWEEIVRLYRLTTPKAPPSNFQPDYNVAPTRSMPLIRPVEGGRELAMARWGLIPFFSKDGKANYSTINARAETVRSSAIYKQSFARRRCLIPTSGWYEWKHEGEHKLPHFIRPKADGFAFAGLWDRWTPKDGGESIESFTIITTEAHPTIAQLHDRMPRVLLPAHFDAWLDPDPDAAATLLNVVQCEFDYHQVDKRVGNVKNNDADLIKPLS